MGFGNRVRLNARKNNPVYQEMLNEVVAAVDAGALKDGDWLDGEHSLARQYKIGRSSVRTALGVLIAHGIAESVPGKGTRIVKRKDNPISEVLVLFLSGFTNLSLDSCFYYSIVNHLVNVFAGHGVAVRTIQHTKAPSDVLWKGFSFPRSTAVILLAETSISCLPDRKLIGGPVIQVDHNIPELCLDSCELDNSKMYGLVADHLLNLGHRRIAYVGWVHEDDKSRIRSDSFPVIAQKKGLLIDPENIIKTHHEVKLGIEAAEKLLNKKRDFTAIVGYGNSISSGLVSACRKAKVKTPEELGLFCIGYYFDPADERELAHIDVDFESMAELIVERLNFRALNPSAPPESIYVDFKIAKGMTLSDIRDSESLGSH